MMYGCTVEGNSGERSAWLECALGVSLLMFGAMLERCCALLPEAPQSQHHTDALLLLPAIKVTYTVAHPLIDLSQPVFITYLLSSNSKTVKHNGKLIKYMNKHNDIRNFKKLQNDAFRYGPNISLIRYRVATTLESK